MKTRMKRKRAWSRKNSIGKYNDGSMCGRSSDSTTTQDKPDKPRFIAANLMKKAASC